MAKNTETVEATEAEVTPKQVINDGITRALEATGTEGQKNRYKVMRAIAFQAFVEAIEADDFDALVDRAVDNADTLPAGWELERTEAAAKPVAKKATKAKAKPAAAAKTKTAAKAPAAKKAGRRRPARATA